MRCAGWRRTSAHTSWCLYARSWRNWVDARTYRLSRHPLLLARGFPPRARSCGCGLMRWPGATVRAQYGTSGATGSGTASADLGDFGLLHSHLAHGQLRRELTSLRW